MFWRPAGSWKLSCGGGRADVQSMSPVGFTPRRERCVILLLIRKGLGKDSRDLREGESLIPAILVLDKAIERCTSDWALSNVLVAWKNKWRIVLNNLAVKPLNYC
jgi:hypothetical protein